MTDEKHEVETHLWADLENSVLQRSGAFQKQLSNVSFDDRSCLWRSVRFDRERTTFLILASLQPFSALLSNRTQDFQWT